MRRDVAIKLFNAAVRIMNWERGGHCRNRNAVGEVLTFGRWIVRHNGNKIAIGLPVDYI